MTTNTSASNTNNAAKYFFSFFFLFSLSSGHFNRCLIYGATVAHIVEDEINAEKNINLNQDTQQQKKARNRTKVSIISHTNAIANLHHLNRRPCENRP